MSKVIATQVTVTKVILELDVEEAEGLQALLWRGVGGSTLDELNLTSLGSALTECDQISEGAGGRYFVSTAQL